MTLNQLNYFYQAAMLQHFNQAAEKLNISQPSLSRSITALEDELGITLFEKSGRNVVLTKAGKIFLEHVTQILDDVKRAELKMHQLATDGGQHTVTFDANGGEGSMAAQTFEYGVDETLTANSFNRANFKFTDWNTAEDGSGAIYADEGSIIDLTEDITLYAQWQIWSGWYTDTVGTTYYKEGEQPYKSQWATIDGNTYYFNEQSYIVKGLYMTTSQDGTYEATFVFDDETGIFLNDKSGLHDSGADTYWIQNGEVVEEAGLQRVVTESREVNYYYFAFSKVTLPAK